MIKRELDWNITLESAIIKLFKLKQFNNLIEYFLNIYFYDETHDIIKEYGKN